MSHRNWFTCSLCVCALSGPKQITQGWPLAISLSCSATISSYLPSHVSPSLPLHVIRLLSVLLSHSLFPSIRPARLPASPPPSVYLEFHKQSHGRITFLEKKACQSTSSHIKASWGLKMCVSASACYVKHHFNMLRTHACVKISW